MKPSILITGAGSGIGKAMAKVLSERNPELSLILTGRNPHKLEETLGTLPNKNDHQMIPLDVTDKSSIVSLRSRLHKDGTLLKGLVLNAGIGGENKYGDQDRWDEIIATNLTGPYLVTQELLPLLKANQSGYKSIVFISSILARLGVPK